MLSPEEKSTMQAIVHRLLEQMLKVKASDMFITAGFPPAVKISGKMTPMTSDPLSEDRCRRLAYSICTDKQWAEYERNLGVNFAIATNFGRFRVNIFTQQRKTGMVVRVINTTIPDIDDMGLPAKLKDVAMERRGLVLLVGGAGSGKSTTLSAMIGHRNKHSHGHILTIEDPVEYVHPHNQCMVTHREVGVDSIGWHDALKDAARQAPDVILIGEIRDAEAMEYALNFAETGRLCMAALHASNANQAIDRIINFFPIERREQALMRLSLSIRGVVSQRLVPKAEKAGGGRAAAIEILLGSTSIRDAICRRDVDRLKGVMASRENGMQTFDQALFDLYELFQINLREALSNADSQNDLRMRLKLESKRFQVEEGGSESGFSLGDEDRLDPAP